MATSNLAALILVALGLVGSSSQGLAQGQPLSSTQPLPIAAARHYVVISAAEAATHVKTQRPRAGKTEHLELLNVRLPSTFVRQQLLATQDITLLIGLFPADELLVTLAVLPDPRTGQVTWVPIDLDSVATRQVPWARVAADCYTRLFNFEAARNPRELYTHRRMDLQPVVRRGQRYFTPDHQVLTEYFVLRNYPAWYPTSGDNALINCLAHPFTPLDMPPSKRPWLPPSFETSPYPFARRAHRPAVAAAGSGRRVHFLVHALCRGARGRGRARRRGVSLPAGHRACQWEIPQLFQPGWR